MARESMSALITRVRSLIGDTGTLNESDEVLGQRFTDDEIQAVLDARSRLRMEVALHGVPARDADGNPSYRVWTSGIRSWEADATLLDDRLRPIANESDTYTEDAANGVWTFADSQEAVYVTGHTFDVYAAAADLLDEWAISAGSATVASGGVIVEWETDGQRVKRAASSSAERKSLAASYRSLALPTQINVDRNDLMGTGRWG